MMSHPTHWRAVPFFLALALLAACSPRPAAAPPSPPSALAGHLTVFAASSLTEAFHALATSLQAQNPSLSISYNFAGTPTLRTQLEQGARADLFAAASTQQMDLAARAGVIQGSPVLFAANRLVVATPAGNARVKTLADLAAPGVKLVLALRDVPAGQYAREALARLDASDQFGPSYAARVLSNLASEETNVRQALSKVALGEADAAIVYTSDIAPGVTVGQVAIPDMFNVLAQYPIAVVRGSAQPALAQAFIAYLSSAEGKAVLARYGFLEVPP